jgi:ribonuclease G
VISVSGASALVGEKTLVRIEQVGRSAANASLVNPPAKAESDGGGSDGEAPKPRRRGRRGGRRRRKSPESSTS